MSFTYILEAHDGDVQHIPRCAAHFAKCSTFPFWQQFRRITGAPAPTYADGQENSLSLSSPTTIHDVHDAFPTRWMAFSAALQRKMEGIWEPDPALQRHPGLRARYETGWEQVVTKHCATGMHSQIRDRLFTLVHGLQSASITGTNGRISLTNSNHCTSFPPRQSPVEICQKCVKSRRPGEQREDSFYRSVFQFSWARQDGQTQCTSFSRNFGTETNGQTATHTVYTGMRPVGGEKPRSSYASRFPSLYFLRRSWL
ncbi:hypothetical protein C8R43DRAFT_1111269 [Mycena crocata]|nr:hypothetical protein C8R43DRAFT_1111269 [Mycena crocata]